MSTLSSWASESCAISHSSSSRSTPCCRRTVSHRGPSCRRMTGGLRLRRRAEPRLGVVSESHVGRGVIRLLDSSTRADRVWTVRVVGSWYDAIPSRHSPDEEPGVAKKCELTQLNL